MLWIILTQFLFRATFGVAFAMIATPASLISSGFFRVHLWVIMGANTLVALTLFSQRNSADHAGQGMTLAIAIVVCSYFGAVAWLYEKKRTGNIFVALIMTLALIASVLSGREMNGAANVNYWVAGVDALSAGFLLGSTLTAMFLGHWYLNSPGMQLQPLRRLVLFILIAVSLRMLVCGTGLREELFSPAMARAGTPYLLALRWLSGLLGLALMAVMTWNTLRIPNTQSATGILYVGVIFACLGELTSQFLTAGSEFPL